MVTGQIDTCITGPTSEQHPGNSGATNPGSRAESRCKTLGVARGAMLVLGIDLYIISKLHAAVVSVPRGRTILCSSFYDICCLLSYKFQK